MCRQRSVRDGALLCLKMTQLPLRSIFFFFNDTATTEIYTLSLHDALPIFGFRVTLLSARAARDDGSYGQEFDHLTDRKSTRLNSSHSQISYAVFCLKKKKPNGASTTRASRAPIPTHRQRRPLLRHPCPKRP